MSHALIKSIREHQAANPERSHIADQMLKMINTISREFSGEERERLLATVSETFHRLVAVGEDTKRARANLKRLRQHQRTLAELLNLAALQPVNSYVH